jgi:hypothetical protein
MGIFSSETKTCPSFFQGGSMSVTKYLHNAMVALCLLVAIGILPTTAAAQTIDEIKGPVCVLKDTVTGKSFTLSPERSLYNVVITDGLAHIELMGITNTQFVWK